MTKWAQVEPGEWIDLDQYKKLSVVHWKAQDGQTVDWSVWGLVDGSKSIRIRGFKTQQAAIEWVDEVMSK